MPSVDVEKEQAGAPVTQDDLRTLRRWIVVAGVWAVAATVVALVALLDDSGRAAERRANETGRRVAATQQRVDDRLARLERRLNATPTTAQVQQLRTQVDQAQRAASGASSNVTALERRVDSLESDWPGSGTDTSPDDGGDSPDRRAAAAARPVPLAPLHSARARNDEGRPGWDALRTSDLDQHRSTFTGNWPGPEGQVPACSSGGCPVGLR